MKEKLQYRYAAPATALEELENQGFTIDYNVQRDEITNNPEDFEIVFIYRYEGMTNPDDESTVYGIKRLSKDEKGFYVVGNLSLDPEKASKILLDLEIKRRSTES
ncbi:hypothetical protein ACF3NR_11540 [Vaginella massiliensis]|uniref:hypothetical protein n=1 Tax=Vaginella massiliensis TaxID=1816680 RepID=UPI000838615E|nr:hypothetical protein [Vaginella massiliensis]